MDITVKTQYRNDKLKSAREAAGLSQGQLAGKTGVNVRMIQYYEQGAKDVNAAKLSTLLKICLALNCHLSDILNDTETEELLSQYDKL